MKELVREKYEYLGKDPVTFGKMVVDNCSRAFGAYSHGSYSISEEGKSKKLEVSLSFPQRQGLSFHIIQGRRNSALPGLNDFCCDDSYALFYLEGDENSEEVEFVRNRLINVVGFSSHSVWGD